MKRVLTLLVGGSMIVSAGACITKSKHLKITGALKKQIEGYRKQLADKSMEADNLTTKLKACMRKATDLDSALSNSKATLDRAQKNLSECHQLIKGEAGKVANLSRELREKEATLFARDQALKKKEAALRKSMKRIAALQGQINRLRRIFDDLRAKLSDLVKAGKLTIRIVRGMLIVQLPERILFPTGRANLKSEGKAAIVSLTSLLKEMKHRWQIAGHTDTVGSAKYNWQLSVRRAQAVLKVMLGEGMPPEQISVAGFGQYQPIVPNDTKENKALNRRTELLLVPDLTQILQPLGKGAV